MASASFRSPPCHPGICGANIRDPARTRTSATGSRRNPSGFSGMTGERPIPHRNSPNLQQPLPQKETNPTPSVPNLSSAHVAAPPPARLPATPCCDLAHDLGADPCAAGGGASVLWQGNAIPLERYALGAGVPCLHRLGPLGRRPAGLDEDGPNAKPALNCRPERTSLYASIFAARSPLLGERGRGEGSRSFSTCSVCGSSATPHPQPLARANAVRSLVLASPREKGPEHPPAGPLTRTPQPNPPPSALTGAAGAATALSASGTGSVRISGR